MAKRGRKDTKVELNCDACGKTIKKPPCMVTERNYCNLQCYRLHRYGKYEPSGGRVETKCFTCGKLIKKYPYQLSDKNFCSRECTAKSREVEYVHIICEWCEKGFDVVPSRADAKFCSSSCFNDSIRGESKKTWARTEYLMKIKSRGIKDNIFVCKNCGKAYIRWRRVGDEGKEYCSRECFFDKKGRDRAIREALLPVSKNRSLVYFSNCEQCGVLFTSRHKKKRCSQKCCREYAKQRSYLASKEAYPSKEVLCLGCGKLFITEYGCKIKKFCSRECSKKYSRKSNKKLYGNHRRKARTYGCAYEPVNILKVFNRDGWACQICGKPTPKSKRGKHCSNSPELDHITPISLGGGHTYKNVQCACRACNQKKGANGSVGNQFQLFPVINDLASAPKEKVNNAIS